MFVPSVCSTTLWIGHLTKQTTEEELQEELSKYGEATINVDRMKLLKLNINLPNKIQNMCNTFSRYLSSFTGMSTFQYSTCVLLFLVDSSAGMCIFQYSTSVLLISVDSSTGMCIFQYSTCVMLFLVDSSAGMCIFQYSTSVLLLSVDPSARNAHLYPSILDKEALQGSGQAEEHGLERQ